MPRARLDANGIVNVSSLRETEDALFFVMRHVEGPSLRGTRHKA